MVMVGESRCYKHYLSTDTQNDSLCISCHGAAHHTSPMENLWLVLVLWVYRWRSLLKLCFLVAMVMQIPPHCFVSINSIIDHLCL